MISDLILAKDAAIEAGGVILNYYKADYEIRDKGYHNPVTTADHAADACLKDILMKARPEYGWLSEETVDSPDRLSKDRVWVVDPLDGTKEFIEGVPNFVVSVALVEKGEPIVGVLYNPVTKETFTAAKGEGAFLNGEPIICSTKENLVDMVILNSRSETRRGLWKPFDGTFGELKEVGEVEVEVHINWVLLQQERQTFLPHSAPKMNGTFAPGIASSMRPGGSSLMMVKSDGNPRRREIIIWKKRCRARID